jgi:hypothetical protein
MGPDMTAPDETETWEQRLQAFLRGRPVSLALAEMAQAGGIQGICAPVRNDPPELGV